MRTKMDGYIPGLLLKEYVRREWFSQMLRLERQWSLHLSRNAWEGAHLLKWLEEQQAVQLLLGKDLK